MIRINLLSEGRRPVVARKAKATLGDQDPSLLILLSGVILGLLVAAGMWWHQHSKIKSIDQRIERAQREVDELKEIIQQVEDFKAKKADLENKIAVIQDLKRKQKGPVQVMDNISRSIPELLWLESMRLNGTAVNLRGQALNTAAVASLIGNLNEVEAFQEPDTKDVKAAGRNQQQTYSFTINFNFVQNVPEEEEPALELGP